MRAPARVIAVLLAAAGIASSGLQMPIGMHGHPDIFISRRNSELADARERGRILYGASMRVEIGKPFAAGDSTVTGLAIRGVSQTFCACRGQLIGPRRGCRVSDGR